MGTKRSRRESVSSSENLSTPFASREPSVDTKIIHLDAHTAISDCQAVMICSLPPHPPLEFAAVDDYEVHYQQTHLHRCSECFSNFPDEHFLHLHISENHDPFRKAKADQGEKTYACLVPDCDRLCSTPQKRRLHCIDKHHFPRNYDFFIVNDGIDRRGSMLRSPHRRRSSTVNSTAGRRRGDSINTPKGDAVQVANDGGIEGDEKEDGVGVESDRVKRTPMKLRGRGGFGHPRGSRQGGGTTTTSATQTAPPKVTTQKPSSISADPMESLASHMSALQFVPHSLYSRGKGRGGAGG
ncbi:hypothetical protein DM02DRAFT_614818 [Periconia macrospinosa]|uniref:C2H2-type domain-containing protein n=1 Tax=Periconia macrospinosa TaxID=97972 RepID=A0A2V1DND9_9PLEO|nr:hypothetical protein DM02DRAFT_614818 [Periconia macrospinosa]